MVALVDGKDFPHLTIQLLTDDTIVEEIRKFYPEYDGRELGINDLRSYINDRNVEVVIVLIDGAAVGFVIFSKVTGANWQIHVGFRLGFRGQIAKGAIEQALWQFYFKTGQEVFAVLPEEHRSARQLAIVCGFEETTRVRGKIWYRWTHGLH